MPAVSLLGCHVASWNKAGIEGPRDPLQKRGNRVFMVLSEPRSNISEAGIYDLLGGTSQEFPLLGINQFRLDGCHWQPTSFDIIARTCCSPH